MPEPQPNCVGSIRQGMPLRSTNRIPVRQARVSVSVVSKLLGHGSVSKTLNIYVHVLAEHLEQFERQRAKVLGISGTYRAPEVVGVAKEQQVA